MDGLKRVQLGVKRRSIALIEKELMFLKDERQYINRYSVSPKFAVQVLVTVIVKNDFDVCRFVDELAVHALSVKDVSF